VLHSMLLAHSLRLLQLSSEAFEAVRRIVRGGARNAGFSITAFVSALQGSFLSNLLPLLLGALAVSPTAGHPVLAVRLLPSLLHLMRVVDSLNMRLSALTTDGDANGAGARSLPVSLPAELDWLLRLECSLGILCGTLSRSLIAADHIRMVSCSLAIARTHHNVSLLVGGARAGAVALVTATVRWVTPARERRDWWRRTEPEQHANSRGAGLCRGGVVAGAAVEGARCVLVG
jgi:hypothetical protein